MESVIVYGVSGSPFTRSALLILEEKQARYTFRTIQGGLREPEHLARHPFGRIPVIAHDGFLLYECQAILRYLDRVLPGASLTPSEPRMAARMDQLININDWYLFQGVGNVIGFHRIVGPALLGLTPDEEAIKAAMPSAHRVFDELAHLLADSTYLTGDALTLADLLIAPALDFLQQTPEWEALAGRHVALLDWLERVRRRPSMTATTWERMAAMSHAATL
jgi:glutathione S-transferase